MLDSLTGGHYWCDGHHAVETMDNPELDRLPGCMLTGPFTTWEQARQFGLKIDPSAEETEVLALHEFRESWNQLLEGIPGL